MASFSGGFGTKFIEITSLNSDTSDLDPLFLWKIYKGSKSGVYSFRPVIFYRNIKGLDQGCPMLDPLFLQINSQVSATGHHFY